MRLQGLRICRPPQSKKFLGHRVGGDFFWCDLDANGIQRPPRSKPLNVFAKRSAEQLSLPALFLGQR